MEFKEQLNQEILAEFKTLETEMSLEEYKTTIDGLTKLMDRAIEIEKSEKELISKTDSQEEERRIKEAQFEAEQKIKTEQLEEDRKSRKTQMFVTIGSLLLTTGVTIWGTLASFKFERDGNITTIMGRGFIQKMLPKK